MRNQDKMAELSENLSELLLFHLKDQLGERNPSKKEIKVFCKED